MYNLKPTKINFLSSDNLKGFKNISSFLLWCFFLLGDFCILFYEKVNACWNNFPGLKLICLLLYFWVPKTTLLTLLLSPYCYLLFSSKLHLQTPKGNIFNLEMGFCCQIQLDLSTLDLNTHIPPPLPPTQPQEHVK